VLINKLQQSLIKQLTSRHTLLALASCILLFICAFLSESAVAMQEEDPTRPPNFVAQQQEIAQVGEPRYVLSAIFSKNNERFAIVNGHIVKSGDKLANMLVTDILSDKLTLTNTSASQDTLVLELSGAVTVKTQVTK
jgi:hypothetical protein